MSSKLERAWYSGAKWPLLLSPLEALFCSVAAYQKKQALKAQWLSPVPLIIVGNINVGGTGKSPLVIHLIGLLRELGYRPGVVSRGYGSKAPQYPFSVEPSSSSDEAGDEPLMIVQRTGVPFVIDPDRPQACRKLLESSDCNIIISDDGLQHYAMGRDIEIAVIDSRRGLGNGHCLPVGPLREKADRLSEVDFVVVNGHGGFTIPGAQHMVLKNDQWLTVKERVPVNPDGWQGSAVHAVAGIGRPERFYETLRAEGLTVIEHSFADHHHYTVEDISFNDQLPVIMTEKDAVKCRHLLLPSHYFYLTVKVEMADSFKEQLQQRLVNLVK